MKGKKKFFVLLQTVLMFSIMVFSSCQQLEDLLNPEEKGGLGDSIWVHHNPQNAILDAKAIAIGLDGSIYYSAYTTSGQMYIYAVNKSDGNLKWRSQALANRQTNSNLVIGDNGNIYVTSYTKLYSINSATGNIDWTWEVPQTLSDGNGNSLYSYGELGPLALSNAGELITKTTGSGSYYRALFCIGTNGTIKWYRFIGSELNPISVGADGTIFDFEHDSNGTVLTATNKNTGGLKWSISADGNAASSQNNILIADNGDVITLITTDNLVRINPATHTTVWKTAAGTYQDYKYMDGFGNIILFDQFSGSYLYSSSNGKLTNSGLPLPHLIAIDSKNHLYGVLNDGNAHLSVTDETGKIIWENETGIYNGTAAISTEDNIVYVSIASGILALKTDATMAQSGWPRFSHDTRNTFNVNKW